MYILHLVLKQRITWNLSLGGAWVMYIELGHHQYLLTSNRKTTRSIATNVKHMSYYATVHSSIGLNSVRLKI